MSEATGTTDLEQLAAKIEKWREQKINRSEKMPIELWEEVIELHKNYPHQAQLHRRIGVTSTQIKNKVREFADHSLYHDPAELCQIPAIAQDKKSTNTPTKTQDNFSALATVVVELCRQDGVIMKIHTTTQSMQEIINSFIGGGNATVNCQA